MRTKGFFGATSKRDETEPRGERSVEVMSHDSDRIARETAEKRLQERLERSTKYELGRGVINDALWQGIKILEGDTPQIDDGEVGRHNWGIIVIDEQKWLFLQVGFPDKNRGFREWTFALNCNSPQTILFLNEMLRTKRVAVVFPNNMSQRLDPNPADSLVEDHGETLKRVLPAMRKRIQAFQ